MPGIQTEEEEGVDHSRYLASYREQESPKEERHGNRIREAEREIQAAVPRSRRGSEEDNKGRQAGIHGRLNKLSRRGHQQGRTRTGVQDHQAHQWQIPWSHKHPGCG